MTSHKSASGKRPPQLDPDADILTKLARGDAAALGALMTRHMRSVKSAAWHMLGDEMMAEDIAQEVFLRAWKQAPTWQPGRAKFSTWMHRVAKNLCLDRLRKKTEILGEDGPEMVDDSPSAARLIITGEDEQRQKAHIGAAMAALPERQRLAIILCHYQNLSQIEAADIMDVSVRAYESLLARGRRNLRARLERYKEDLLER